MKIILKNSSLVFAQAIQPLFTKGLEDLVSDYIVYSSGKVESYSAGHMYHTPIASLNGATQLVVNFDPTESMGGRDSVAAIAFYSSNDESSYMKSVSVVCSSIDDDERLNYTIQVPQGATHVAFSSRYNNRDFSVNGF